MSQRFLLAMMCSAALSPDPPPTALVVSPPSVAGGRVGEAYSETFTATGNSGAISWTIESGSLPPGLNLNASTGVLSGAPTTAGTSTFVIKATDAALNVGTRRYSIEVVTGYGIGSQWSGRGGYENGALGSKTKENYILELHAQGTRPDTFTYTGGLVQFSGFGSGRMYFHAPQNGVWQIMYHSAAPLAGGFRFTIKRIR